MRGKAENLDKRIRANGITPAYAGKSMQTITTALVNGDHPRLCGEKLLGDCEPAADRGSPPPMRGKANQFYANGKERRITPAYAGKRFRCRLLVPLVWDHPRLCGEKDYLHIVLVGREGSPPPMRGKVQLHRITVHLKRITPAYAGKRHSFSGSYAVPRDHPRLCGEKLACQFLFDISLGSPPPMRGKAST